MPPSLDSRYLWVFWIVALDLGASILFKSCLRHLSP